MDPINAVFEKKKYLLISEISELAQIPEYTLRYWESQFKVFRPLRLESGHRRYTLKDMNVILELKELLYGKKLTIAGARQVFNQKLRPRPEPQNGAAEPPDAASTSNQKAIDEARKEIKEIIDEMLEFQQALEAGRN